MVPLFNYRHEADGTSHLAVGEITIAVGFRCNLQCYGCSTVSNYKVDDPFILNDRINWLEALANLLSKNNLIVGRICIGGGEPFLSPQTPAIIKKVAAFFPKSMVPHSVVTNGLLVRKNTELLDIIQETGRFEIGISVHKTDRDSLKEYILLKQELQRRKIPFYIKVVGNTLPWLLLFNKNDEGKVIPAESDSINASWASCKLKYWAHLHDFKLLKCTKIAYLDRMLTVTKQLDDPQWKKYRDYAGLDCRTADLDDIIKFFSAGPEDICKMCSDKNVFYKSKPLYRNEYDSFAFEENQIITHSLRKK